MDRYQILKTFMDITDTRGVSAKQTKTYDASGRSADGNTYMTGHTVTSSSTGGNVVREITLIEIYPPQNSDGHYEDLREVWLTLDGKSTQHYLNLPGQGDILMTPPRQSMYGGPHLVISLGDPLWKVVQGRLANPNMPLRAIAPKYAKDVALSVMSQYAVSSTADGGTGFRIVLSGYEYTAADLAQLAPKWNNSVSVQTLARIVTGQPALAFTYTPPPLTMGTFTAYPGGVDQLSQKINAYWHFARPAEDTDSSRIFVLSNFNALGGGTGHVSDTEQDLGVEFNLNNNALVVRGFGVRGVPLPPGQTGSPGVAGQNLASAGWFIDGNIVPEEIGGSGLFMSQHVQPLAFGALSPFQPLPGVFRRLPAFPGELLIYKDQAAPFIAANGSPIAQDTVAVGVQGVLVEQG